MPLVSNNADMKSGVMSIELTHPDFPDETFRLSDVATMSGDWDVSDSAEASSTVYFDLGGFEFSCFEKMSDDSSLLSRIKDLPDADEVSVRVDHTFKDGSSFSDLFKFDKSNVSYNWEKREVTIKARNPFSDERTIRDFINNHASNVVDVFETDTQGDPTGTIYDGIVYTDFLDEVLFDVINPFGTTYKEARSVNNDNILDNYALVSNLPSDEYIVEDVLFQLAALDGGIIGSVLGHNFYVNRLITDDAVTISQDDTHSFNEEIGYSEYISILCDLDNMSDTGDAPPQGPWRESHDERFDPLTKKALEVIYQLEVVNRGAPISGGFGVDEGGVVTAGITEAGVGAYAAAYGADGRSPIEIEIMDIKKVPPYAPITLDSSFDTKYQGTYRASNIEYDFAADISSMRAYPI